MGRGAISLTVKGPEAQVMAALQDLPGVARVVGRGEGRFLVEAGNGGDLRPELARLLVQQGFDLLELKAQEFTLEDVFLNLVTEEETEAES
jgi:ABC-2 type transport system ATP-binding protein